MSADHDDADLAVIELLVSDGGKMLTLDEARGELERDPLSGIAARLSAEDRGDPAH